MYWRCTEIELYSWKLLTWLATTRQSTSIESVAWITQSYISKGQSRLVAIFLYIIRLQTHKRPLESTEMAKRPLPIDIRNSGCVAYPKRRRRRRIETGYFLFVSTTVKSTFPLLPFLVRKRIEKKIK